MLSESSTTMGMSPLKVDSQQSRAPWLTFAHSGDGFFVMSEAGGGSARIGIMLRTSPMRLVRSRS